MPGTRAGMPALVILAAGSGNRAGGPKAWIPFQGSTWLEHQLEVLPPRFFATVHVLISEVPARAPKLPVGTTYLLNPRPELGPFHSIQLGLAGLADMPAVFVLPVDVPVALSETFRALTLALGQAWAAIPTFEGRGGHPVALSPMACADILAADPTLPGSRLDFWMRERRASVERVGVSDSRVIENFNLASDFSPRG